MISKYLVCYFTVLEAQHEKEMLEGLAPSAAAKTHTPCLFELLHCPWSPTHGLHHTIVPHFFHHVPLSPFGLPYLPLLQISMIMCRAHQDKPGTPPVPGFFTLLYLQNHSFCMQWRFICPRDYSLDIFWKEHYSDSYIVQPKNCTYLTPKRLAI